MRYLLVLVLMIHCGKKIDLKKEEAAYDAYLAALPELKPVAKDKPVILKVLQVDSPNLPGLDEKETAQLYAHVEKLAQQVLGYDLKIQALRRVTTAKFFGDVKDRFITFPIAYPAHAFRISYFAADRDQRISEVLAATLKNPDKKKLAQYLGDVKTPEQGTQEFLAKLTGILAGPDLGGKPLVGPENRSDEIYFSYGHWSSLLQGEREADFILTNGGILGADNGMPLYVIARGGVTNAFVENNAYRPYQGAGVLGMYPFLAETQYFNERRGKLTKAEKREAIAWIWIHELGHMLLKKEENYSFADSVHRAPTNLRYMDWVQAIRATKDHRTGQIKEMKKF